MATKQELLNLMNANLPDNTSGLITPGKHREFATSLINQIYENAQTNSVFRTADGDFGVLTNGSDQTTNLQNAIDVCAANSYTLLLPKGTILVGAITLPSNLIMIGAGIDVSVIKRYDNYTITGAYHAVLTNETKIPSFFGGSGARDKNIILQDFTVDGNAANLSSSSSEAECVSFYGVENVFVNRVKAINATADGFDADFSDKVYIKDCSAYFAGKSGLHLSVGSPEGVLLGNNDCVVQNFTAVGCAGCGVSDYFINGRGLRNHFENIFIDSCGTETGHPGAFSMGGVESQAQNITILNSVGNGFASGRHGSLGTVESNRIAHNIVQGLQITESGAAGVYLDTPGITLIGGYIANCSGVGILSKSTASQVSIQGINTKGNSGAITIESGSSDVLVAGNNFNLSGAIVNASTSTTIGYNIGLSPDDTPVVGSFRELDKTLEQYFEIAHNVAHESVKTIAITFSMNSLVSAVNENGWLTKDDDGASDGDFIGGSTATLQPSFGIQGNPGIGYQEYTYPPVFQNDKVVTIIIVLDAANSKFAYYVDDIDYATISRYDDLAGNQHPWRVGSLRASLNKFTSGKFYYLGFWDQPLTPAQVTQLSTSPTTLKYADLTAGLKTDLISWYDFDQSSGNEPDKHGSFDAVFKSN